MLRSTRTKKHLSNVANFLFEITTLKRLQRTGWQILGEGKESIAEHSYMVTVIASLLAIELQADLLKVLLMGLYHDAEETRTGDIYRLADAYVTADTTKAKTDIFSPLPQSSIIQSALEEYEVRESLESKIVKDADTLALCLELKPMVEKGNLHAEEWLIGNIEQLKLPAAQAMGDQIRAVDSQAWWRQARDEIQKKHTQ